MTNVLYIGNKNYATWSLRAWLALRWGGIPFEERIIRLDQPGYGDRKIAEVMKIAPNGRVPCLHAGDLVIWDSLAIAEWAAELQPSLWPADRRVRAEARSVTAEMHSGFQAARRDFSMNIRRRIQVSKLEPDTKDDIARIDAIWGGLRARYHDAGPWLFGPRSIADAFYAPMATRLRTYGVTVSAAAQSYCDALFADPDFRAWEEASIPNSWDASGLSVIDGLYA